MNDESLTNALLPLIIRPAPSLALLSSNPQCAMQALSPVILTPDPLSAVLFSNNVF